jgi:hypothetical protein
MHKVFSPANYLCSLTSKKLVPRIDILRGALPLLKEAVLVLKSLLIGKKRI